MRLAKFDGGGITLQVHVVDIYAVFYCTSMKCLRRKKVRRLKFSTRRLHGGTSTPSPSSPASFLGPNLKFPLTQFYSGPACCSLWAHSCAIISPPPPGHYSSNTCRSHSCFQEVGFTCCWRWRWGWRWRVGVEGGGGGDL